MSTSTTEHRFSRVEPFNPDDLEAGWRGFCQCGWDTGVLPDKDEAWEEIASHILPFLHRAIGGLEGGSCRG